jgi:hypothetical protein
VADSAVISYLTSLGYGMHSWDFPIQNLPTFVLLANVAGTLTITAAIWSKTSFAFTILRLSDGWLRYLVIALIVTMNIFMGVSALLPWVQCRPIQKAWNPLLPGECNDAKTVIYYNIFSGGRCKKLVPEPGTVCRT